MASVTPMHQGLQTQLRAHLGPNVAVICAGVDGDPDTLWREERAAIAQAIPRRQREFAAGRAAARQAMLQLGWTACPVPANPDRSPCWPAGLIGSISHSPTICVVVLGQTDHWHSIGVDIESDRGVEPSLWSSICSHTELTLLYSQPEYEQKLQASRIFTAKEAFYKFCNPEEQIQLEFQSATTVWSRMNQNLYAFQVFAKAVPGEWHIGYCMNGPGFVVSWVTKSARDQHTKLETLECAHANIDLQPTSGHT